MNIDFPKNYYWLIEKGLISFDSFGPLEPWFYLPREHQFIVNERWPKIDSNFIRVAFAKRQDNDEIACFIFDANRMLLGVDLIQGWTGEGYVVLRSFPNLWEWLKYVIDDIAIWFEQS